MKKLLSLIIISLFVMSGLVFADSSWTYENVTILGPRMGSKGQTPPVEVIKVTIGSDDDAIVAGDVMAWSIQPQITDGNALGFFVEKMRKSSSEDLSISEAGHGPYAGVMITSATSNDQGGGGGFTNTNPQYPQSSIGYMAIRGFVDAYCDAGQCTQGDHLVCVGGKTGQEGDFATMRNSNMAQHVMSEDIGVLLEVPGSSDGLLKVWLR